MDELIKNNKDILINYPQILQENLEELFSVGKLGLLPINSTDVNKITHLISKENEFDDFHLLIKIPYAGKRLSWQLIFSPEHWRFACDFDFNDELFLDYLTNEMLKENVPSLVNWSLKSRETLTTTLNELLVLYKKFHIEKLKKDNIYSRFYNEYEQLMENGTTVEEIEIFVEKNSVNFLISVNIDCSNLPEYVQPLYEETINYFEIILHCFCFSGNKNYEEYVNPGLDYVHIAISFRKLDGNDYNSSVELSPHLKQVFEAEYFFNRKFSVVPYKGTTISKYIEQVQKFFKEKIIDITERYELKKEYVLFLVAVYAENLIEYDSITYSSCSFLYDHDNFECIIRVNVCKLDSFPYYFVNRIEFYVFSK